MSKIQEIVVDSSKVYVNSTFLLKIKVERMQSHDLMTEDNSFNLVTEDGKNIITEGDYYE